VTRHLAVVVVVGATLFGAGCSSTGGAEAASKSASSPGPAVIVTPLPVTPSASPTSPPAPAAVAADAVVGSVPDAQWARIVATGAWHVGCPASQRQLRRVEVNFHGFDGAVHRGVLVVNADVASEVARIFTHLFDQHFPIHRMVPIEAYGGDDNASMAADNTSAYNCRRASQANAPPTASPHANGRAIDVNPYENPWVDDRCGCFEPDTYYGTHRAGTGVITKGGIAWTVFTKAGWIWQDNASIDFQHFDTGYPSVPR
jgi:D-alanyl-D-alanine carboxypeptidase